MPGAISSLQPWETTTLQSVATLLVANNLVLLWRALRIATRDRARIITRSGLLPFDDKPPPAVVAASFLHSVAANDQGRLAERRPRPFSSSGPLPPPPTAPDVPITAVGVGGGAHVLPPPPPPPTPPAQPRYQSRRPAPLEVEAALGMCGMITQRVLVARGALMAIIAVSTGLDAVAWIVFSASPRTDVPVAVMHRIAHVAMITAGNLVTAKRMRMLVDTTVRAKWGVPWTWVVGVTVVLAILWLAAGVLRIAQAAAASTAFWQDAALPEWTSAVALAVPIGGPLVIVAGVLAGMLTSWRHQRTKLQPMLDNSIGTSPPSTRPSTLLLSRLAHAVSVSLTASSVSTTMFASRLTLSGRSARSLGGAPRLDSTGRTSAAPALHVQATSTESHLQPGLATASATASGAIPAARGAPTLALPGGGALPRASSSPVTLAPVPRNRADSRPRNPPVLVPDPTPTPRLAPDVPTTARAGMNRSNSRGMVRSNSNSRGMVRSRSTTSTSSHQSRGSRASTAESHVTAASGPSDQSVGRMRGAIGDWVAPSSPPPPPPSTPPPPAWSTTQVILAVHLTQAVLWAVVLSVWLAVSEPVVAGVVADAAVTVFVALDMRFYGVIRQRGKNGDADT